MALKLRKIIWHHFMWLQKRKKERQKMVVLMQIKIVPLVLHTAVPMIVMLSVQIYSGCDTRSQPLAARHSARPRGGG